MGVIVAIILGVVLAIIKIVFKKKIYVWLLVTIIFVYVINMYESNIAIAFFAVFWLSYYFVWKIVSKFIVNKNKKKEKLKKGEVEKLVSTINTSINIAENSKSIYMFLDYYDKAIEELKKLKEIEENPDGLKYPTNILIYFLNDEFQWHLCDAVVRVKKFTIEEIQTKYINSKEFQRKCAYNFYDSIKNNKDRFSKDSLELADEALREVFRVARADYVVPIVEREAEEDGDDDVEEFDDPVDRELRKIDFMEGHEFEYWCAELLKRIGFSDVEVTQGSGDQGVDVLAVKDGIRYAIQCKCYATDLGNKPVQEVNTGKSIYRCQIGAVMTNRYFTQGAQQAAQATGVLLWDRTKLREMIELSASAL